MSLRPHRWDVQVVQTTATLSDRLRRLRDVQLVTKAPRGVPVIHVRDGVLYQRISGVGGAMTDSAAWLMHEKLKRATRTALMKDLFSAAGIHLTFIRVPMGASDFTVHGEPYSYDDLAPGQSDPQLLRFSVAHDERYVLPSLRQMLAINPKAQILANPWSPPPWMKANGAFDDRHFRGTLLPSAYTPLAGYFVKFVQAYARRGVPIAAITPQNEPRAPARYPSMSLPVSSEARFIVRDLAPALRAAMLSTKIYGADTAWGASFYPAQLAATPARGALSGIAEHCYSGIPDVMSSLHAVDPGLDQIVSECAPELTPYSVPEVVIGSIRNWASAVALWNLALDPSGGPVQPPNGGCGSCQGLVTINPRAHTFRLSLAYYQLGQVGRFVQPGAWRIGSEHFVSYYDRPSGQYGVTAGLDDTAFVNPDGSRVLVAYNNSSAPIRFALDWKGRSFTYTLAAGATVTFRWNRP
ncbi:MAG: glycoside hydrolase family 30 protein [Solirubrobacteraceae bacterium]